MKPRPYSKELEALRKNLELRLKNGIEFKWAGGFEPEFLVEGVMARVEALIKAEKIDLLRRLLEQKRFFMEVADTQDNLIEAIPTHILEDEIKAIKESK